VALSARRFDVQRLELRLSIGGFAAAIGAMIAGIFGMNLRSTFEESVLGFWGTTAVLCVGCYLVYLKILSYARRRKILVQDAEYQ
jgi:magnesium transporter